ncbi:hypothetical protein ACVN51_23715, partial [Escherichia coli]
ISWSHYPVMRDISDIVSLFLLLVSYTKKRKSKIKQAENIAIKIATGLIVPLFFLYIHNPFDYLKCIHAVIL